MAKHLGVNRAGFEPRREDRQVFEVVAYTPFLFALCRVRSNPTERLKTGADARKS